MILKFWPRWPQKRPLNLSSLKIRPVGFILNYIFEISGFHWSKCTVECAICLTLILKSAQARCVILNTFAVKQRILGSEMFSFLSKYSCFRGVQKIAYLSVTFNELHISMLLLTIYTFNLLTCPWKKMNLYTQLFSNFSCMFLNPNIFFQFEF